MRDLFSGLAIFLIVASMGLLEAPDRDKMVSDGIRAQAVAVAAGQKHPVEVTVDVRDIVVSGRVESRAERQALLRSLRDIEGVEGVSHTLVVLPNAAPFTLSMQKTPEGVILGGHTPSEQFARRLSAVVGSSAEPLVLATGAPDAEWGETALLMAEALLRLQTGEVTLAGHEVSISGQALLPATVDTITRELAALPPAYQVTQDLSALDDGAPYSLFVTRDRLMGVRASGKLPPDADPQGLMAAFDRVEDTQFRLGVVDLGVPGFLDVALQASDLLADLPQGNLVLTGQALTLSGGPASAAVLQRAEALAAALPSGFHATVDLVPADDDVPLGLVISVSEQGASVRGKTPASFDDRLIASLGAETLIDLARSPYPDLEGWSDQVPALVGLAGQLVQGEVQLQGQEVTVTGAVETQRDMAALNQLAAELPAGLSAQVDVHLADAYRTPVFTISYAAETGARYSGILPEGLTALELPQVLGLPSVLGRPRHSTLGDGQEARAAIQAIGAWLPEAETMTLSFDDGALSVTAVLSPGADVDLILGETTEAAAWATPPDLSLLQSFPQEETQRRNAALQAEQIFLAGYWLPNLSFEPTLETCRAFTADALADGSVKFLSGSQRLDARAVRVINRISAVARRCVNDGGLVLEIGGHTDNVGSNLSNQRLSQRRADSVAEAIGLRGVLPEGLQAEGHGPALPIADNATPEGRAANRRIAFDWPEPLGEQP